MILALKAVRQAAGSVVGSAAGAENSWIAWQAPTRNKKEKTTCIIGIFGGERYVNLWVGKEVLPVYHAIDKL